MKVYAPNEDWSSRAASCDGYETVHCPVPKAGLSIPLLFEERSDRRLQCGNDMIVPRFLTGPDRHKGCVQKVQSGEENLQMFDVSWWRRGIERCTVGTLTTVLGRVTL